MSYMSEKVQFTLSETMFWKISQVSKQIHGNTSTQGFPLEQFPAAVISQLLSYVTGFNVVADWCILAACFKQTS